MKIAQSSLRDLSNKIEPTSQRFYEHTKSPDRLWRACQLFVNDWVELRLLRVRFLQGSSTTNVDHTLVGARALEERQQLNHNLNQNPNQTQPSKKKPPTILKTQAGDLSCHLRHQTACCHLTIKDLSSSLIKRPSSDTIIVDWLTRGHASIGRLTHTGSQIYWTYSELQSSIQEFQS